MQASDSHRGNLGTLALVLLISGAIDSIRNLPATAMSGTSLVFFFLFSALVFLVPVALVSARLASAFPKAGGVYQWVSAGLGEKTGFLAIWLQWINTMVWFPTILSFIAGTAAWLINPHLIEHRGYLVSFILALFWGMTLLNLRGIRTSARFANACAVMGMIIPMTLIIVFAGCWIWQGQPLHLQLNPETLLPSLTRPTNWIALTAIMTAFLGMELATVHIRDVKNPRQTFPKALLFSVLLILATMILGSLSLALVLPPAKISLVGGVMQAFESFLNAFHLPALIPVLTVMLLTGSLGGMTSWLISPARGLLQAAEQGFLPGFFTHKNRFGVASRILLAQACVVSLICLAFLLMPGINGSYWLLSDLSTELYVFMYVLMFLAALRLEKNTLRQTRETVSALPMGRCHTCMLLVCLLGLSGCLIALIAGFVPPAGIAVGSTLHYESVFCTGLVLMMAPVLIFLAWRRKTLTRLPLPVVQKEKSLS